MKTTFNKVNNGQFFFFMKQLYKKIDSCEAQNVSTKMRSNFWPLEQVTIVEGN